MLRIAILAISSTMVLATTALAAPALMVQPKSAAIITGGPGSGSITDTYNQSGLAANYTDEATEIHGFAPTLHTPIFANFEWFGAANTTDATVSYLVSVRSPKIGWIDHIVLWNEESSGIGSFNLWYGTSAGAMTTLLLRGAAPTDHPVTNYFGDVWQFARSPKAGWYTIEASGCPQPNPGSYPACAIGEVAFGGAVPEPASWALMVGGFGLMGYALRRRRAQYFPA